MKANERRRKIAAAKQKPLPPAEQEQRCAARRAEHLRRYPVPPVYAYTGPAPTQPLCYLGWRELRARKRAA